MGVCSHNNEVLEKAVFENVELITGPAPAAAASAKPRLISTLETVPLASKDRRAVLTTTNQRMEAPNWTPDGQSLVYNWFPHPSPDGKWLVFLTYEISVAGHPENQDVTLRLLALNGEPKAPEVLAKLFGGQGTINVPSWSPDSKKLAFVSYQLIP